MRKTTESRSTARGAATPPVQRSDARSNRARILDVAQRVLADNPDATINDVAAAAGVVRRTVYAHFASREALIDGIALEAADSIASALGRVPAADESAVTVFVRQTLALTRVGDQYRLLLAVARTDLGHNGIHNLLGPMREAAAAVIRRGQREGVFSSYQAAEVLILNIEAIALSILEATNAGLLTDPAGAATTSSLVLLGIAPEDAERIVADVRAVDSSARAR
ncbi:MULTISPECIES: TetR/AcrR family transcriptional regulator [Nocardiaceae]|uniref:TetR/AcrR family transcriptional regulator n=1 Tax=Nocardiaceae TaxID=85025 RepID=UPI0024B871AE|nr:MULTISPECIES: TetR/AcrR family transcriptional regulator [Rhodococcus]MDI9893946.1 TetR/AcrR family transcriptional regulator [Rhodococcus sp. IEGM 1381]